MEERVREGSGMAGGPVQASLLSYLVILKKDT